MPVKIIDNTGTTRVPTGEIKLADLEKMKDDFITQVSVTPVSPRTALNKKHSFYFSKDQFIELFNSTPSADLVKISICVQVPDTIDLCGNNLADALATIIEMVEYDTTTGVKTPVNNVGNFVLINGYQNNGVLKLLTTGGCCPSTDP